MTVDSEGRVTDSRIAETVIRVDRRMTYTAVNRILTEQDPALMEEYGELVPMFFPDERAVRASAEKQEPPGRH